MEKAFLRINIFWYAFYGKFATLTDFGKKFFSNKPTFFKFEKSYEFSRILRYICYDLVIEKFQIQNLQHRFDWMIFHAYSKYDILNMDGTYSQQFQPSVSVITAWGGYKNALN